MTDVRPFSPTPMDLALVRRVASAQVSMDTTTALTRGVNPLEAALLTVVPLADLGFPTLILRNDEAGYIGQIRHRSGETRAHLASLAPAPDPASADQSPWLQLIDGLVKTAGRRGALMIVAEISETAYAVFELLRKTGFVVYTRQTIYQYQPGTLAARTLSGRVQLRPLTERDIPATQSLYASLVPQLVQQIDPIQAQVTRNGTVSLVVESINDRRLVGHLAVIEGKSGVLVKPLLHPDVFDEAGAIISAALPFWPKIERLPLYISVRAYQEWLGTHLLELGLAEIDRQVVFVKHTVARIDTTAERLPAGVETIMGSLVSNVEAKLEGD
ncbi:MAG: hypothetical protein GYB66_12810 [Chloroflexi bacterium]|nr:hypothetical protein [Chloroflexota bacterium]